MPCSERRKELKRRRHRRQKLEHLKRRLHSANTSEKALIAEKIRQLTPGYGEILTSWGLDEQR